MGKRKESFFERLTKKNAQQDSVQVKPRKRKAKRFIWLGAGLTTVVATGITVPIVVTTTKTTYVDPLSENTVYYKFSDPSGAYNNFTIGSIEKSLKNTETQQNEAQLNEVYRYAIYYLYEQEAKASVEYQRLYNASRASTEEEVNNLRLKSLDELRTQYRNEIEDLKENTIKKFGISNWETEFNKILVENYGNAKTIEEAVENKVYQAIQNDALRRFRLNTNSVKTLVDRVAINDIYKTDENGEIDSSRILVRRGEKVFPWLKEITQEQLDAATGEIDGNYFKYNDDYMGFMTDSFVESERNANKFLEYYLNNDDPFIFTQFTLPGVAKVKNTDTWKVDRSAFKFLIYAWPVERYLDDETTRELANTLNFSFDMVQKYFKPLKTYLDQLQNTVTNSETLPTNLAIYNDVLQYIATDSTEIKNNFGSPGLNSLTSLLTASETTQNGFLAPKLKAALYPNSPMQPDSAEREVDYFGKLREIALNVYKKAWEKKYADDLSNHPVPSALPKFEDSTSDADKKKIVTEYNELLKNALEANNSTNKLALTDEEFDELVTQPLAALFQKQDATEESKKEQISTFYKLKDLDGAQIMLTSTGTTLIYPTQLEGETNALVKDLFKMILSDFIVEKKYSTLSNSIKYNVLKQINQTLSQRNYVLNTVLQNADFHQFLKSKVNSYALDDNGNTLANTNYTQAVIDDVNNLNKKMMQASINAKALAITKNVDAWMTQRAKDGADDRFEQSNGLTYITTHTETNPDGSRKTAGQIINDVLKELLVTFKER
ncbi:HinT-interacting membrane complex protein P80 [Mycoplasmopsis columbinasalis]|uniref:Membrane protein P80 n=1 Tax=Mycoplasmopsis columbinasalis TaxID=114880 RepID=A0A449BAT3_9BACT|nr:hypothetical protein [Mycoplasmopsis columbinasalis]VEU78280.1 Uncharacterised protein [Mycoplasmopsis columbinasalis]